MRNTDEVQGVVQFYRDLGLVSAEEVVALGWLLGTDSPYAAHLAAADSVHTHILVHGVQMQRALRQLGAID